MREILFRGKAINREYGIHRTNYKNGDWVYGLVTKLYDEQFNLPAEMANTDGVTGIEIDYKTIGQFTGLTDKNGKKIFEGDIVKHYLDKQFPKSYQKGVIFYDNESLRWKRTCENISCCVANYCIYEVIGNIHDNPELLERGCDNG